MPPLPVESVVVEQIDRILESEQENVEKAISLCLYAMKTQVFIDGNKRASVIYANHYLIAHGDGFLVIPEEHVSDFKGLLLQYYEGQEDAAIKDFMRKKCWRTF